MKHHHDRAFCVPLIVAPMLFQSAVNVEVTFQDMKIQWLLSALWFVFYNYYNGVQEYYCIQAPLICDYQTANFTLTIEDITDPTLQSLTRKSLYTGRNRLIEEMIISGLQIKHFSYLLWKENLTLRFQLYKFSVSPST